MRWTEEDLLTESRKAVVLGASGHAKVVIETLRASGWVVMAAFDDDPGLLGVAVLGAAVIGPIAQWCTQQVEPAIVCIGSNRARQRVAARAIGGRFATAVHPFAWVAPSATLGEGTVVLAGAVIQADASIGGHVIVNTGASIDHDCKIGDLVHVAPGARLAGGVVVGEGALIGIGAVVIPGIHIGAWATVGAGAAVVRDVSESATVVGVPARVQPR